VDDTKRISWFRSTVAIFFIVSIFFAGQLWTGVRSYPFAPLLPFLSSIPAWGDFILLFLLLSSLIAVTILPKPKIYLIAAVALGALFFAQDQNRLFPSFFEYWTLLLILAFFWHESKRADQIGHILNACRVAIAFIYFWSGVQKLTPGFEVQLVGVLTPLTNALPFLNGSFIAWAAILAPWIEIEIGIGLLFKKTRKLALAEAIFMHAALFFLLGPFRDPAFESAWIWNLASACIAIILFFKATDVDIKKTFLNFGDARNIAMKIFVLVVFGILPALNFINLWDSSLSFNVFSGNMAHAEIDIDAATVQKLPAVIRQYVGSIPTEDGMFPLDIDMWTQDEFHSQPVPAPRIFQATAKSLCQYASQSSSINLTIYDKLKFYQEGSSVDPNITNYNCADL
jgi:hypothetical protein